MRYSIFIPLNLLCIVSFSDPKLECISFTLKMSNVLALLLSKLAQHQSNSMVMICNHEFVNLLLVLNLIWFWTIVHE